VWAIKAGVPQIHPHSLRHKFATDLINRGGSPRDVQRLLGHASLATTEAYLALTDENLKKTVSLLVKGGTLAKATPRDETLLMSIDKLDVKLSNFMQQMGMDADDTGGGETYFDLRVKRDEQGEPVTISIDGGVPIEKVSRAIAKYVARNVKIKKDIAAN
jgi:hypothetical protein